MFTAHFFRIKEEFDWLHKDEGSFGIFSRIFKSRKKQFVNLWIFKSIYKFKNLSFTHCVEASDDDLEKIKSLGASINHCVTSNRLLNNTKLDLNRLKIFLYNWDRWIKF